MPSPASECSTLDNPHCNANANVEARWKKGKGVERRG
jgi:hypothetical protein